MRPRDPGNARRAGLVFWTLAPVLGACASIEIAMYKGSCVEVTGGEIDINCDDGTWSFAGLCARVLHPACPDMNRFVFEAGVDSNDNGQLDDREGIINIDDHNPGDEACVAASSGSFGDGNHNFIYHYEVYVEGQDTPVASNSNQHAKDD